MNVPLPTRVVLGQCLASGLMGLGAAFHGPVAAWSVLAGAGCCVLPGAFVAQWAWRRGVTGLAAAMMQPVVKLVLSAALLAGVLGGLPGVQPLAALAGFTVAVIVQPAVLIVWR